MYNKNFAEIVFGERLENFLDRFCDNQMIKINHNRVMYNATAQHVNDDVMIIINMKQNIKSLL